MSSEFRPRLPGRQPLRRRSVLAAAFAGGAAALASCTAGRAAHAPQLTYWNLFTGGDGENMQTMVNSYRSAHPDVAVQDVSLEWGDRYYTKFVMAAAADRAPDVGVLHLGRLPAFAPGGFLEPLQPALLDHAGLAPDDFPERLWHGAHHDGRLFALPLDTHPFVLYYNTEICRRAGLLDEHDRLRPLDGPRQLRIALRAVQEVTGEHAAVVETAGPEPVSPWRLFWTLYRQTGSSMVTPDGNRLALDDAAVTRVLSLLAEFGDTGLLTRHLPGDAAIALFGSGRAGFMWHGAWEVTSFLTAGTPFSMAPFPTVFDRPATEADAHAFVLPGKQRSPEQRRRAYEFISWLLRHSLPWARGGHIPAYRPITNSTAYTSMRPQAHYRSVIDDVELDPPVWFAGSASQLWTEVSPLLGAVINGTQTVPEALTRFRSIVRQLLDTPNPTT